MKQTIINKELVEKITIHEEKLFPDVKYQEEYIYKPGWLMRKLFGAKETIEPAGFYMQFTGYIKLIDYPDLFQRNGEIYQKRYIKMYTSNNSTIKYFDSQPELDQFIQTHFSHPKYLKLFV